MGTSIVDFIAVESKRSKEKEVQVCEADIGAIDHCLAWTKSRKTRRNCLKWARQEIVAMDHRCTRSDGKTARVPTGDGETFTASSEVLETIGTTNKYRRNGAGATIAGR